MSDFEISSTQRERISQWHESIKDEIIRHQRATMNPVDFDINTSSGSHPYYGAIGGGLTYSFTPTGVGVVVVVTEHSTRKSINVSEFEKW